jgi:hypothetical protein
MKQTKYTKTQIGYIAQNLEKAITQHKNRELTEKERELVQEIGFLFALSFTPSFFDRAKRLIDEYKEEKRQNEINKLEDNLRALKE